MRNPFVLSCSMTVFSLTVLSVTRLPASDAPSPSGRPNIIFIEVDDLCYTYSGVWGSKTAKTPVIDQLAKQGFVFDQGMCQGTMCGPSRNSLITGKYPHQLGFYQNGDLRKLPRNSWVLPKALQNAGYTTAWIGKSHLKPYFATRKDGDTFQPFFGFDFAVHTLGRTLVGDDEGIGGNDADNPYMTHLTKSGLLDQYKADAAAGRNSTLPEDDYLDGWFTKNVENYLTRFDSGKPLFLWVNYSVPHGPYDVADAYHQSFTESVMPGVSQPTNYTHPASLIERTKTIRNERYALDQQRGYHANIQFMDRQVGRVLAALDSKGLLENSWVFFFSDQGVMEGAHGLVHKHTLFRQITQPALIVRPPGSKGNGQRVAQPVELLDLLPTALEIAGAPVAQAPNGTSLLPLFDGKSIDKPFVFAEIEKWIVVSDGRHRLIRSVGNEPPLLFDDVADPENLTNIAAKHPRIVQSLSAAIDDWLRRTGERLISSAQGNQLDDRKGTEP